MAAKGILIEGLRKRYGSGDTAVNALKGVNMEVAPGEVVGLIGPSGSGKSTLLKCLGAVIDPTAGRMTLENQRIHLKFTLSSARAAPPRRRRGARPVQSDPTAFRARFSPTIGA